LGKLKYIYYLYTKLFRQIT